MIAPAIRPSTNTVQLSSKDLLAGHLRSVSYNKAEQLKKMAGESGQCAVRKQPSNPNAIREFYHNRLVNRFTLFFSPCGIIVGNFIA
jgi:hypothetical protein